MTTQMAEWNSPHESVGEISTPMLVIHGDKDYRCRSARACGSGSNC